MPGPTAPPPEPVSWAAPVDEAAALDISGLDPAALVRVDVPDYPGALTTSRHGSLLAAPPDDPATPWRPASIPQLDRAPAGDSAEADVSSPGPITAWEAIDALGVEPWHAAGYDGSGVKVAVFDVQWHEAELASHAAELGDYETHDCYAHRSCDVPMDSLHPRFSFESGSHGVACAQLIRDIAPGVELHLVRVNGLTTLENAVDWAVRNEIDLVSMSLSFFNESFYDGTGAINEAMDTLMAGGVQMVSSAGNYATEHYRGRFEDRDFDGRADLPWGSEYLPIYLNKGGSAKVNVLWDNLSRCGQTDLDLFAYNQAGELLDRSTDDQVAGDPGCFPLERVTIPAAEEGWYYLQIYRKSGSDDLTYDVMARDGEVYGPVAAGSVTDPGTHPAVFTVGAVRAVGYATNGAESFSSRGPTGSGLTKPDIAGPDGVSSSVYGPTGFYGTSASTPAVVGALALLLQADPEGGASAAVKRLKQTAIADADPLWDEADPDLGAGRARLPPPGPPGELGCRSRLLLLPLIFLAPFRRRRRRDRLPGVVSFDKSGD